MLEAHLPLFLMVILATGLGATLLTISNFLGPRRPTKIKLEVFECGNPPTGPARERFNVKFYLVAILFLVFDIEAVFIYPWAVTFSDAIRGKSSLAPAALAGSMLVFAGLLVVSLVYEWRKGALEWAGREEADNATLGVPHNNSQTPHGLETKAPTVTHIHAA